jgi:hypothetical protein
VQGTLILSRLLVDRPTEEEEEEEEELGIDHKSCNLAAGFGAKFHRIVNAASLPRVSSFEPPRSGW